MLRSARGRELAARMPCERTLTESDGPFAQVDGRPAFPWDVAGSIVGLAEIWGVDTDAVRAKLFDNLRNLSANLISNADSRNETHGSQANSTLRDRPAY